MVGIASIPEKSLPTEAFLAEKFSRFLDILRIAWYNENE
jgi:hypothetical protein